MSNHQGDPPSDDFLDQILGFQSYGTGIVQSNLSVIEGDSSPAATMMLQLGSGDLSPNLHTGIGVGIGDMYGGVGQANSGFPLGLSLERGDIGFMRMEDDWGRGKRFRDGGVSSRASNSVNSISQGFRGQPMTNSSPAILVPPVIRPRVRARRGQATDPHSIAERLRREKIAERSRALQELVPSVNKTDRATMVDEIVDYVKFLRLQVKVLSMSRLGGAGAVAPLVTEIPISSAEEMNGEVSQPAWEKWSNDGTERQVAKLMEENVGAAMQFLQSKTLCIMPISLASAIYHTQPLETDTFVTHESNPPS